MQEISDIRARQRAKIKDVRRTLKLDEWKRQSDKVFRQLIRFEPLQKARTVHCYLSSESLREVDTRPVLSWMLEAGKDVYVPVMAGREIHSVRYEKQMAVIEGNFGVLEPEVKVFADESQIDLVLVPLLAVDQSGNRLGYGKGYYDRFFNRLAEENILPIKVGLAFDFQLVERIPVFKTDKHEDVPLDAIVTETRLICVKQS